MPYQHTAASTAIEWRLTPKVFRKSFYSIDLPLPFINARALTIILRPKAHHQLFIASIPFLAFLTLSFQKRIVIRTTLILHAVTSFFGYIRGQSLSIG